MTTSVWRAADSDRGLVCPQSGEMPTVPSESLGLLTLAQLGTRIPLKVPQTHIHIYEREPGKTEELMNTCQLCVFVISKYC